MAKRARTKSQAPRKKTATRARIRAAAIKALERDGRVTAERLVQAARNPKHPMHVDFEWNDSRAAERYRLDQGRTYIAEVRVSITTSTAIVVAPGYLRDRDVAPLQGYIATQRLRNERAAAGETILYELSRAHAILERVREIAAALECENELDMAIAATRGLHSRVRMKAAPSMAA